MGKRVRLLVLDAHGAALGEFRCRVDAPWLQETSDVLGAARAAGLDLAVLRLLAAAPELPTDGGDRECVYLAQALSAPPAGALLAPSGPVPVDEHPLRMPYARPNGVVGNLAWADDQLRALGLERAGAGEQQRTWNLSCVHRLPLTLEGTAWLKAVPPFFAHEGRVIDYISRRDAAHGAGDTLRLPPLLAADGARGLLLLEHCAGPLLWGITPTAWAPVIAAHVDRQMRLHRDIAGLLATGMPDYRAAALLTALRELCARPDVLAAVPAALHGPLADLIAALPDRLSALAACGLPDTLVHGDLHPGNVIGTASGPVLLDWGDAGVGQPLLDLPALCHGFTADQAREIRAIVTAVWQERLPQADVARAMALSTPLGALRQALVYQRFLDAIEPAERHYHDSDVPERLAAAVAAAGQPAGQRSTS